MSATLAGSVTLQGGQKNLVIRFFTPNTTTEVAKYVRATNLVHLAIDATNTITSADASDQTTLNTLLNEIKADYNAHRVSTTFHSNADTTNAVTSADATDLASSITLANEIKVDYNAHRSQANVHPYTDYGNEVTSANGTDLATTITLANEAKGDYNAHRTAGYFTVDGITPGTYDIGVKCDSSLSILAEDQVFTEGETTTIAFGTLLGGDLNGTDSVNILDSSILTANYNLKGGCYGYAGNWLMPDWPTGGGGEHSFVSVI